MNIYQSVKSIIVVCALTFSFSVFGEESDIDDVFFQDCYEAFPYSSVDDEELSPGSGEALILLASNDQSNKGLLVKSQQNIEIIDDEGC